MRKVLTDIFRLVVFFLFTGQLAVAQIASPTPEPNTNFINSIPDMTQGDPRTGFPGEGDNYCAPVSVSNSLMWLANTTIPGLVPKGSDPFLTQVELARLLGSPEYMNTDLDEGTGTTGLMLGVKKYIEKMGRRVVSLRYQGWRSHPTEFTTNVQVPSLLWMQSGIHRRGAVWINVGWYDYVASTASYNRIGGHWVTMVGFGVNPNGTPNPSVIIVHDPANRAGFNFENEYVQLTPLRSGTLKGNKSGLPRSAKGYYRTDGGMHIKSTADVGIIDGVVRLVVSN
jgi:hypothetical protein